MNELRPNLIDASAKDGVVTIVADGEPVMIMSRARALWLIARLAEVLARSA